MNGSLRVLGIVLALCCFGACKIKVGLAGGGGGGGVSYNDVEGSQDSAFIPVLRARVNLSHIPDLEVLENESVFLEASASSVEGSFGQNIGAGRAIIGGRTVTGDLDVEFTMSQLTVAGVYQMEAHDALRGAVFGGVCYHDVSMDVDWSGGRASQSKNGLGGVVGGQVDVRAAEWAGAYARGDFTLLSAKSHSIKFELGIELNPSGNVAVLLGYRWWDYLHDHGSTGLDLGARGVLAGMRVDF